MKAMDSRFRGNDKESKFPIDTFGKDGKSWIPDQVGNDKRGRGNDFSSSPRGAIATRGLLLFAHSKEKGGDASLTLGMTSNVSLLRLDSDEGSPLLHSRGKKSRFFSSFGMLSTSKNKRMNRK